MSSALHGPEKDCHGRKEWRVKDATTLQKWWWQPTYNKDAMASARLINPLVAIAAPNFEPHTGRRSSPTPSASVSQLPQLQTRWKRNAADAKFFRGFVTSYKPTNNILGIRMGAAEPTTAEIAGPAVRAPDGVRCWISQKIISLFLALEIVCNYNASDRNAFSIKCSFRLWVANDS